MYDSEANKYGADYAPFDNTMAFSDVSIRAGEIIDGSLNILKIKYLVFRVRISLNYYVPFFCRIYPKGKHLSLSIKLNCKTAEFLRSSPYVSPVQRKG